MATRGKDKKPVRRRAASPRVATRGKKAGAAAAAPKKRSLAALRGELAKSQARFRSLVETAAAPILLLAPDLTVSEINSEAERLFGRMRRAVLGTDYFDGLDRDGRSGISRDDFKRVLAGRAAQGIEGRIRRPDGSERVMLWNLSPLVGPRRRVLGIIAVAQDITERQQAEEALREREARLSSIIDTAPDAIITIDERGIVQSFSIAAEKLFGYEAGEVIGRNISLLMPSPHQENHDGYLARYLSTGERRIIGIGRRVEAKRRDGSVFPVELAVGEARFGNTRIFTGFIRDLTTRTRMEEELRQSQKMEAIGQLTGGLAHDFNNLLTVIMGNLEMLEPRLDEDESREILGEAQEATALGAKLASRMLAFGRRQPLNPKPIDLSALVGGVSDLLRRSLGETIRIESRLAKDLPTTLADPGQVENVLLNLAINARDAMAKGGHLIIETATIRIRALDTASFPGLKPGHYVMLAVTDDGAGMSPEVRERAFEPFFTTKSPGSGTGLGLSMVYGFVKQSGGYVHLYSEAGKGTTVRIYLPAIEQAAVPSKTDESRTVASASGEIVLVVEDDDRVRRVSCRRLKKLGYTVLEANSGEAALAIIERGESFDLLFTDMVMPGMTGTDLAQAARRHRPELKVLFTSGYAEPSVSEGAQRTQNADWLGKPHTTDALARKLRQILER